jgi:hypothetical protein
MVSCGSLYNSYNEFLVSNSLSFSQAQINIILGCSLASIYQDVLNAPVPEHLKAIIDRLDERDTLLKDGDVGQ